MTPVTTPTAGAAELDEGVDPSRLTRRLRCILAIVIVADVLDLMDSAITNIAAPTIVRDIGGGESLIKWLGASYALAMGVLLVVGGRLGDRLRQATDVPRSASAASSQRLCCVACRSRRPCSSAPGSPKVRSAPS